MLCYSYSLNHFLIQSLSHSLTHSLSHSLPPSLTHPLTHSLTRSFMSQFEKCAHALKVLLDILNFSGFAVSAAINEIDRFSYLPRAAKLEWTAPATLTDALRIKNQEGQNSTFTRNTIFAVVASPFYFLFFERSNLE